MNSDYIYHQFGDGTSSSSVETPHRPEFADDRIAAITDPLTDANAQLMEAMIGSETDILKRNFREQRVAQLSELRAREEVSKDAEGTLRQRVEQKRGEAERLEDESPITAWLYLPLAAICFVAEFALTWFSICYLLSIRQYSPLGVAVAAAPTAGLVILDLVFLRLIEAPWQAIRSRTAKSTLGRPLMHAVMVIALLGLAWMNVNAVLLLAHSREEANRYRRELEVKAPDAIRPLNRELVARTVTLVSLTVAIDGAVFLLLGVNAARWVRRRRSLLKAIATEETEITAAEQRVLDTRRARAQCEATVADLASAAEDVARNFTHRRLLDLRMAQQRAMSRSPDAFVRAVLTSDRHRHATRGTGLRAQPIPPSVSVDDLDVKN